MTTENHTATQHEFVRKCLHFFYEDITQEEYDGSEDDLREYAATINEGFGYDLDQQLAALTAERDGLAAENARLQMELEAANMAAGEWEETAAELLADNAKLRAALKPFAEYAATLTNWDSDPVIVARWRGVIVTAGDFRKVATALGEAPTT